MIISQGVDGYRRVGMRRKHVTSRVSRVQPLNTTTSTHTTPAYNLKMGADIIDLISSSPSPPVTVSKVDFKGLTDEFDQTWDLDDPFVSTPPTANPPSKVLDNGSPGVATSLITSFGIQPDDIDTAGSLDESILAQTVDYKRRRISPSFRSNRNHGLDLSVSSTGQPHMPPVQRYTCQRHLSTVTDPIQLTSSPAQESTASRPQPSTSTRTANTTSYKSSAASAPVHQAPCSPNPFQSSQEVLTTTKIPSKSKPTRDSSPNPFDSSPPPRTRLRTAAPSHCPSATEFEIIISSPPVEIPKHRQQYDRDPISSSAPEPTSRTLKHNDQGLPTIIDLDSNSEADTDDDLPDIDKLVSTTFKPRATLKRSLSDALPTKTRSKAPKSAEERTREREAKAVEVEEKRRQKQLDKEAKALQKEHNAALAEVNKIRTDKKVSTPEMLVDLPASLNTTLRTQVESLLQTVDVQYTTWDSPVDNVVKWRRKVKSKFDEDAGYWKPIPLRIEAEKHVAVVLTAEQFVALVLDEALEAHISKTEECFPKCQIMYILEGLTSWQRKNRNIRNRQFTSGVRTETTHRRPAAEHIPEDKIEDALLEVQVLHNVLIHHTNAPIETSQWIVTLTQHISTVPYRKQKDAATGAAGFCMESGQVRTSDEVRGVYVLMLQEIARVTAPIAYGVAAEFGSLSELVRGFEEGGGERLADVRKSTDKDGTMGERKIGGAVSRRLCKIFTGRDEMSTDV